MNKEVNTYKEPDFSLITDEKIRVDSIATFCKKNRMVIPEKCLELALQGASLARSISYNKGLAECLLQSGFQYWHVSNVDKGLVQVEDACEIFEEIKAFELIGFANMIRSMIVWSKGEYNKAFSITYSSLEIIGQQSIIEGQEWLNWCLGVFYYDLKDYSRSTEHYERSLHFYHHLDSDDKELYCYALIGLASIEKTKQCYDKAVDYLLEVKTISKAEEFWMEEARAYYELGMINKLKGETTAARDLLMKSYDMRKKHNTKPGMVSCLLALVDLEIHEGNLTKANELMENALQLAQDVDSKPKMYQCHKKLAEVNKQLGDFEKAFYHLGEYHALKSTVIGEETNNRLKDLETRYATEKSDREKEIHRLKNIELRKAHQEIVDSIAYAKRIQSAILPAESMFKACLKNSFVLYKPKDVVAGDFYWLEQTQDKIIFAVADCTGHGVPGAMVSVVCNNALNRSVREYGLTQPHLILDKTRELVISEFAKADEIVTDGMDIALCTLDGYDLEYAGAYCPLWIVRQGEMIEIMADKQPVGKFPGYLPYTNNQVKLEKGDSLYIFSDGYVDQFGGPREKKFLSKAFKALLLNIQNESMQEQLAIIDKTFENWRGDLEQIDDVCVVGVKID